jgi:hypothetical protein
VTSGLSSIIKQFENKFLKTTLSPQSEHHKQNVATHYLVKGHVAALVETF